MFGKAKVSRGCVLLGLWLFNALVLGCGKDTIDTEDNQYGRIFEQAELNEMAEAGLDDSLPYVAPTQVELQQLKAERRQRADTARTRTQSAMAPVVLVVSVFAVESMGDLLMALAPAQQVSRIGDLFRRGRHIRRHKQKHAQELRDLGKEMSGLTGRKLERLVAYSKALSRQEMHALLAIREATKSVKTSRTLLARRMNGEADLLWISRQLNAGSFDPAFIQRFTFDSDMVREYTEHSAHPSWRTLQDIVSKTAPVPNDTRRSLSKKVTGLLGEHAAATWIRTPAFRRQYFPGEHLSLSLKRGVGYGTGNRSLDIIASTRHSVVFAEVKNWALVTWNKRGKRDEIIEQLQRHNLGIDSMLRGKAVTRQHRLLMVRKDGYEQMDAKTREIFEDELQSLGWTLERMPSDRVYRFADLIDSLK